MKQLILRLFRWHIWSKGEPVDPRDPPKPAREPLAGRQRGRRPCLRFVGSSVSRRLRWRCRFLPGHQHQYVIEATQRQLAYAHRAFFSAGVAEQVADTLVQGAPKGSNMSTSSRVARRRSRPRSSSHANTMWAALSRSARCSSRTGRATTATRSAAMRGVAGFMSRCWSTLAASLPATNSVTGASKSSRTLRWHS